MKVPPGAERAAREAREAREVREQQSRREAEHRNVPRGEGPGCHGNHKMLQGGGGYPFPLVNAKQYAHFAAFFIRKRKGLFKKNQE